MITPMSHRRSLGDGGGGGREVGWHCAPPPPPQKKKKKKKCRCKNSGKILANSGVFFFCVCVRQLFLPGVLWDLMYPLCDTTEYSTDFERGKKKKSARVYLHKSRSRKSHVFSRNWVRIDYNLVAVTGFMGSYFFFPFHAFTAKKNCGVEITPPVLIEDHTMHFTPVLILRC